jgi:Icc protein
MPDRTASPPRVDGPVRVTQFTDLHLLGDPAAHLRGVDTEATFRAVLDAAQRDCARADLLLLTGDLAENGEPAAYARLRAHLDAQQVADDRLLALPGNHDAADELATVFDGTGTARVTARTLGGWEVLLLDSSVPGRSEGHLDATQLDWLDARLARAARRHALVVLHHQPLPIGSTWLDAIALDNGPELLGLLDAHANVRGVLFGHVHQAFERRRHGVRHIATPSTCVQFVPRRARIEIDALGPGWRTLELHPDGRIRTRVRRVAAPHPAAESRPDRR